MSTKDIVNHLQPVTVLVIGDVMLDEFLWCHVSRISPEAPVPVCKVVRKTQVPGGAANVASNIAALSSTPLLVGLVGADKAGHQLRECLTSHSIATDFLIEDASRPTILKTRVIAHQQHVARVDTEDTGAIDEHMLNSHLDQVLAKINSCDIVVISDYQKGFLTDTVIQQVIQAANAAKKPIIVDPKGTSFEKYRHASYITPNMAEFRLMAQQPVQSEDDIRRVGQQLCQQLDLKAIILTRSEQGMSILLGSGESIDIPANAKDVFDITGAGDTVVAMLAVALGNGIHLDEAGRIANTAAGKVVAKMGTATVSVAELAHDR